jgi:hypothetical protein
MKLGILTAPAVLVFADIYRFNNIDVVKHTIALYSLKAKVSHFPPRVLENTGYGMISAFISAWRSKIKLLNM